MSGTSNSGYKIRVADINDEESVDCSELFTILPSEEATTDGEIEGRMLVVTSPMDGDMAEACMEYTVEARRLLLLFCRFFENTNISVQHVERCSHPTKRLTPPPPLSSSGCS